MQRQKTNFGENVLEKTKIISWFILTLLTNKYYVSLTNKCPEKYSSETGRDSTRRQIKIPPAKNFPWDISICEGDT